MRFLKTTTTLSSLLVASLCTFSTAIWADDNGVQAGAGDYYQNHPRVNEIDKRLQNQQDRIDNAEAKGKITPQQAERLQHRDQSIAQQEQKDLNKHDGHLTKNEDRQLNKRLDNTSHAINSDANGG